MTKPQHKVSLRQPISKHWPQLDLGLTRCTNLSNVKLTRSYWSADCDTDHSLVCCKVNFKAKRVHHAKKEGRHRINTCMTRKLEKVKKFIRVVDEALPCPANTSAAQRWEHLRDTIYNAASLTFGKNRQRQWIGLRPTWTRCSPSLTRRGVPLPPTKAHPVREHSKCLGRPKAKSNRFQGVVQMTFGFSCAITYRSVLTQTI